MLDFRLTRIALSNLLLQFFARSMMTTVLELALLFLSFLFCRKTAILGGRNESYGVELGLDLRIIEFLGLFCSEALQQFS